MASISSNRPNVAKALFALSQTFNLRRRAPGGNKTLGAELIDTATVAIEQRSVVKQADPDGNPWAKLKPAYKGWKARHGFSTRINVKTGEMLDPRQIAGQTVVTSNTASMTAGLDAETKTKVAAAEEGGKLRPKRPFMDLGKDGEKAVDMLSVETINATVKQAETI